MPGYEQLTIRRNRDNSITVITESTDVDPAHSRYEPWDLFDAQSMIDRSLTTLVNTVKHSRE